MAEEQSVQIPRVKLGSQGLEVSKLGFGCMGLTGIYNDPVPEEVGISIIKHAFSKGITFFDTADVYGANANEVLVGKALKQLPREKIQLATKFGIFKMEAGAGCYLDPWLEVVCNYNDSWASPKLVLKKLHLEVLNISLGGTVRVNYPTFVKCVEGPGSWSKLNIELGSSPFTYSVSKNKFIGIGCNNFASMVGVISNPFFSPDPNEFVMDGCMSICDPSGEVINASSCNGINCCQTTIPSVHINAFITNMSLVNDNI
ncbi:hypothetical protein FH972_006441 [Carpinus fangiana]|uniref:NADP-dependent oxidoreductase domain-containing protein n=1 Tax=Carpinus fangiana TaxID=176857 RepID=A0A5N6QV90_9ROSI|nr:hypothetical protein FH972_006441 [Carpinus fangiana]